MLIVLYILFAVLEIGILFYLWKELFKNRYFSAKTTLAYPLLVILSVAVTLTVKLLYSPEDPWYLSLIRSLSGSLQLLVFNLEDSVIGLLQQNGNYFLLVDYLGLMICSVCITSSVTILLSKTILFNFLRKAQSHDEMTYLIGFTDATKTYLGTLNPDPESPISKEEAKLLAKRRAATTVILPYSPTSTYHEEKALLDDAHVKYRVCRLDLKAEFASTMRSLLRGAKTKKYSVVSFLEGDDEVYKFLSMVKDYVLAHHEELPHTQFVFALDADQKPFLSEFATHSGSGANATYGKIRFVCKYDLIAYRFLFEHNLAQYLPEGSLQSDGTVDASLRLNIFAMGFGKVNQALLKSLLIETQFVKKEKQPDGTFRLAPLRPEVHIYDTSDHFVAQDLSFGLFKYKKSAYASSDDYYDLPEDYASHVHAQFGVDLDQVGTINDVYDRVRSSAKEGEAMNVFLVSFGSDFENGFFARKLRKALGELGHCHNLFFVRIAGDASVGEEADILPFGSDSILNYDNLVSDAAYQAAKRESCYYAGKPVDEASLAATWESLSLLKQESNLYSIASLPFKLSLLGLDLSKPIDPEEFRRRYFGEGHAYSLENYKAMLQGADGFPPSYVFAYSEHERWNAFELGFGALPYRRSEALARGSAKAKSEIYHANICAAEGLLRYYEDTGTDVIGYDFDLMDHFLEHASHGELAGLGILVADAKAGE